MKRKYEFIKRGFNPTENRDPQPRVTMMSVMMPFIIVGGGCSIVSIAALGIVMMLTAPKPVEVTPTLVAEMTATETTTPTLTPTSTPTLDDWSMTGTAIALWTPTDALAAALTSTAAATTPTMPATATLTNEQQLGTLIPTLQAEQTQAFMTMSAMPTYTITPPAPTNPPRQWFGGGGNNSSSAPSAPQVIERVVTSPPEIRVQEVYVEVPAQPIYVVVTPTPTDIPTTTPTSAPTETPDITQTPSSTPSPTASFTPPAPTLPPPTLTSTPTETATLIPSLTPTSTETPTEEITPDESLP